MKRVLEAVVVGAALATALATGWAISQERGAPAGRVPKPAIVQARGDKCVEPVEFMRRSHMQVLLHQRDRTVHEGIRTKGHSLKGCVECHASAATGSVAAEEGDFCRSCHSYAAVRIDCFECHASRPQAVAGGVKP
ncbi:MAG: hypothetical protein M5U08_05530 [Burkholderiales bacterium]|nr:hypothetical protein [Burkholderiales bacterium]